MYIIVAVGHFHFWTHFQLSQPYSESRASCRTQTGTS